MARVFYVELEGALARGQCLRSPATVTSVMCPSTKVYTDNRRTIPKNILATHMVHLTY